MVEGNVDVRGEMFYIVHKVMLLPHVLHPVAVLHPMNA